MVKRRNGGIINVSSLASYQPMPYFSIYAATKAYVTSFTIALYEEYKDKGIHILAVCPGYTKTNFNKRALMNPKPVAGYSMTSEAVVEESLKAYLKRKPLILNGFSNRFIKSFMSLLPRSVALKMTKYIIKKDKSLINKIKLVVVITQNPDNFGIPHSSTIIHKKLKHNQLKVPWYICPQNSNSY